MVEIKPIELDESTNEWIDWIAEWNEELQKYISTKLGMTKEQFGEPQKRWSMDKPEGNYKKNFAIMIPETCIYWLNGYAVMGATQSEFALFKVWFNGQRFRQLQLDGLNIDMWIRSNDLVRDHVGYSLQNLFNNWKQNPPSKDGYTATTHPIKTP